MSEQIALPESIRKVFEDYGVIKRVAVPKLDLLDKAITDRKGRWELTKNGDGLAIAKVTMMGRAFDGTADDSALALSQAFSAALIGTQPRQGGLFDEPVETHLDRLKSLGVTTYHNGHELKSPDDVRAAVGQALAATGATVIDNRTGQTVQPVDPTPDEIARTLRTSGIPVVFQDGVYVDPETGDIFDDERAEWVRREYDALTKRELATV